MKRRLLPFLVVFAVLTSGLPMALSAHSFESAPYTDELGDGVDFFMCFTMDTIVPMPMPMDVEAVAVTSSETESGEVTLGFHVTLAAPPLPHQSYTIEICVDVDRDPSTGAATPACFFNGQGADYDIGVEVQEGAVKSVWVEHYSDGAWLPVGEPTHDIVDRTVTVGVPVSTFLGSPLDSGVNVYLITEGGLDMAPGYGEPPMTFTFNYLPYAVFEAPGSVDEGTPFELDASNSGSSNGAIGLYEWDLDGDGVYEESHPDPVLSHLFADDGVYAVALRVTDAAGFSSTYGAPITVVNTPPYDVVITRTGETIEGAEVTFTGGASDLGEDQLTYSWSFGDGETAEGAEATHTYAVAGDYTVVLTVTDDDGAEATNEGGVQVTPTGTGVSDEEPEKGIDPLLVILVAIFGLGGFLIYDYFKKQGKEKKEKKEEKKEPGDFCEEHPEVVEEENKACEEAMWDLDAALGPIEDDLDAARDRWRQDMREVGRLIMEWDIAYAVIQSLTKSEAEIRKEAEKVQQVAAIVKPGASMGKTAFKKGGEEAMKEMGKHIATEVGKGIAGEVSQTVKDLLSLESWATSEIGIGIAKLITGIDPKQEASDVRKESMRTCTMLQSWVDHNLARTERFTHRTLHTCIDEAQKLIDRINDALKAFEDAVAGFKCVTCELTPEYMEHIQGMIDELNGFMKAFGDLIDQVEQRLNQAVALYKRDDVYDSPYVRVNVQNNKVPNIKKSLEHSAEAKK